jgi:hypothetical protein
LLKKNARQDHHRLIVIIFVIRFVDCFVSILNAKVGVRQVSRRLLRDSRTPSAHRENERSFEMLLRIAPLIALIVSAATASAQVTLKTRYTEGANFDVQTEMKTTQTLTLNGMDIDTKSTVFIVSSRSVGKRAADGTLKLDEKVKSMQTEIDLPGGLKVNFDSGSPDKEAPIPQLEPILDGWRAVCRIPITIELDAKDKVANVKLPEGEFEKLPEAMRDQLSPETLKKANEQATDFLPTDPVKKGDTWERSNEANLGAGQVMSVRTKFEYGGTIEKNGMKLDKITGKAFEVSYSVGPNQLFQVTKSDLKVAESEGEYLFNNEGGYLVSKASKIRIVGSLTLVINNMELPGKLDLTIEENVSRQK